MTSGKSSHGDQVHVQCKDPSECSASEALHVCDGPQASSNNPRTLLLENLLERRRSGSETCHMTSEANLEMLEWLQEGYTLECMSCAVDRLGSLHDSSLRALQHMKTWHKGAPYEEVRLFTDGSYHETTHDMAWSIVAIVREHEDWLFAGFMSGTVATPDDLEFGPPSAYVAEVFAIFHAMVLTSNTDMVTTIKYDCTSAAEVAKNSSKQHSSIAQQMSALKRPYFGRSTSGLAGIMSRVAAVTLSMSLQMLSPKLRVVACMSILHTRRIELLLL